MKKLNFFIKFILILITLLQLVSPVFITINKNTTGVIGSQASLRWRIYLNNTEQITTTTLSLRYRTNVSILLTGYKSILKTHFAEEMFSNRLSGSCLLDKRNYFNASEVYTLYLSNLIPQDNYTFLLTVNFTSKIFGKDLSITSVGVLHVLNCQITDVDKKGGNKQNIKLAVGCSVSVFLLVFLAICLRKARQTAQSIADVPAEKKM